MTFFIKSIFKFKKITLLIIILIFITQINHSYKKKINEKINTSEVKIEIPHGAGSDIIISILKEKKLLHSSFLYKTELKHPFKGLYIDVGLRYFVINYSICCTFKKYIMILR